MTLNSSPGDLPPTLSAAARQLVARSRQGVLCTLLRDGTPYGSVVEFAPLPGGDIVMLISSLAEHRRNVEADSRASLLIAPALGSSNALAQERLTLVGRVVLAIDREALIGPYLAAHPQAAAYVQFSDFAFFRLQVAKARYIGGFGRMGWLTESVYRGGAGE